MSSLLLAVVLLRRSFLLAVALLAMVAVGCGNPVAEPLRGLSASKETSPPVTPGAPVKPAIDIDLRTVDVAGYDAEIARHKGHVVLVDYWANWCESCVAQFPHTVELHEKYSPQGFLAISLSFDDGDEQEKVRTFLAEHKASFPNLMSQWGASSESMDQFDLDKSLPHYRLYDRQGKLRQSWDGKPEGVEEKIEELLKEGQ